MPSNIRLLIKTSSFICVCLLCLSVTHCTPAPADVAAACNLAEAPLGPVDITKTRILIDKSDYTLKLLEADRLLRCYPVVLGFDAVHDKRQEGDGCTPEGTFRVRTKYDHAKWSKFIWVDYPTADSYRKFHARKAAGEIPQTATIGGDIGIHGVPEGMDGWIAERRNWTLGCISMTRGHVDELYGLIQDGTEIRIQP
jgi:murein L,D-transpeptidase YafK